MVPGDDSDGDAGFHANCTYLNSMNLCFDIQPIEGCLQKDRLSPSHEPYCRMGNLTSWDFGLYFSQVGMCILV